jgi:hypothetical protein
LLPLFAVFLLLLLTGCTNNNPSDGNENWLENYSPVYLVGTGSDNFWINFPVGGPSAGQSVQHLTWITEDLEEKPVVFVLHRTGCGPCTPQADRVLIHEVSPLCCDSKGTFPGAISAVSG